MSIEAELRKDSDRWEHRERIIYSVLPFVLLAVSTVIALVQPEVDFEIDLPAVLLLSTAAAIWLLLLRWVPERWLSSQLPMVLHFAGLMALGGALVALAPWYGIFTFIGYVHATIHLQGVWRYLGVVVTATINAGAYLGGFRFADEGFPLHWLILTLVGMGIGGTFIYLAAVDEHRTVQQNRALSEIVEANRQLEAALTENATLHAQLLKQAREAGVLDERQRMAREIHDTLAQSLAGVLTQLQAAEQTLTGPSPAHRHLATAVEMARTSLAEARRTVHAVEPELLAQARLPEAIADVAGRWAQTHGVESILTTTGDPRPMHTDVEVTLLRAAQEALANVAKHADAGQVRLTLSYMGDMVTLDVRDDGIGFEPGPGQATASDGGFGLAAMRQRVQRLAGSLVIESEPGEGTAISASVPAIPASAGKGET